MKHNNPHRGSLHWLFLALLLAAPTLATALESDKDQPIQIEADSVDIDDGKGTSTYKGNVELTQGSIRITADRVTITQHQGQSDHVEAVGSPVTFRQRTEGAKGIIKGRAKRAEYDANSEMLYLIDEAVLTQGSDSFKSDRITYDRARSVVKAGASAKGKKRVRVTIQSGNSKHQGK